MKAGAIYNQARNTIVTIETVDKDNKTVLLEPLIEEIGKEIKKAIKSGNHGTVTDKLFPLASITLQNYLLLCDQREQTKILIDRHLANVVAEVIVAGICIHQVLSKKKFTINSIEEKQDKDFPEKQTAFSALTDLWISCKAMKLDFDESVEEMQTHLNIKDEWVKEFKEDLLYDKPTTKKDSK